MKLTIGKGKLPKVLFSIHWSKYKKDTWYYIGQAYTGYWTIMSTIGNVEITFWYAHTNKGI